MSVSKLKSFSIWAKLNLDVLINIKAESLEDAVEKSKELKELDFVDIKGEFNDGNIKITGAHEDE
jgi:hypothetical protein